MKVKPRSSGAVCGSSPTDSNMSVMSTISTRLRSNSAEIAKAGGEESKLIKVPRVEDAPHRAVIEKSDSESQQEEASKWKTEEKVMKKKTKAPNGPKRM